MCLLACIATIDSSEALLPLTNNECREAVQSSSLTRSALRPEIDTPVDLVRKLSFLRANEIVGRLYVRRDRGRYCQMTRLISS